MSELYLQLAGKLSQSVGPASETFALLPEARLKRLGISRCQLRRSQVDNFRLPIDPTPGFTYIVSALGMSKALAVPKLLAALPGNVLRTLSTGIQTWKAVGE